MKKLTRMFSVLAAVTLSVTAFAQPYQAQPAKPSKAVPSTQLSAVLQRVVTTAVRQHQQAATCCYCGQEIHQGQHCSASDYTTLCTPTKQEPNNTRTQEENTVCPQCGEPYTIDERYHGAEHRCAAQQEQTSAAPVCCRCGEEIHPGQHCAATDGTSLCTVAEPTAARQQVQQAPAVCPKCGEAYTMDERYHGVEHKCTKPVKKSFKTAKKSAPEYCIYCGEAIVTPGQKCTASAQQECTTRCPDCGANLRDGKNVTVSGTHLCRFKSRITPVKPHIVK